MALGSGQGAHGLALGPGGLCEVGMKERNCW